MMPFFTIYERYLYLVCLICTSFSANGAEAYEEPQYFPHKAIPFHDSSVTLHQAAASFPPPGLAVKTTDDYQIVRRLGTGKFSDVFEAVDVNLERHFSRSNADHDLQTTTNEHSDSNQPATSKNAKMADPRTLVVIKCLKPVSERKIRREIAILQHASKLPNLVRLLGIVLPLEYFAAHRKPTDLPKMPSLVLEHAGRHAQWLCHGDGLLQSTIAGDMSGKDDDDSAYLSDYEIRYYMFHLLVALDGLHSIGIMHRDVKARNILINRSNTNGRSAERHDETHGQPLVLIDLGLSDFYTLHQRYNVRVASRHYKSPELLVGYEYYHYSLDLWSAGCVLVGLLLRREPFFRGKDNVDQLAKIVSILGANDLIAYMQRYNIPITSDIQNIIQQNPPDRTDWASLISDDCPMPSSDAIDLLNRLLVYDHEGRLTAKQAMHHRYFDPVRDRVHAELLSYTTYLYPSSKFP